MQYSSKFDIGQTIYTVSDTSFHQIVKCLTCHATGKVTIGADEFVCPKCNGQSAHPHYAGRKFYVSHSGEIGKITIEDYPGNYDKGPALRVTYMIDATGVGSGTVWDECRIFDTREDADAFCDSRNSSLPHNETEMLPSLN